MLVCSALTTFAAGAGAQTVERAARGLDTGTPTILGPRTGSGTRTILTYAGGTIEVDFDPAAFALTQRALMQWVRQSAQATTAYFGRFPVKYVRIRFQPTDGQWVTMGRAGGTPVPHIIVTMGRHTSAATLADETLLVHEMVHLGVPDHSWRYLWLHEGIATYVEDVARAQAGLTSAAIVWAKFVTHMPKGLPRSSFSGGLNGTRSQHRRYWGGALFCLVADVELRKATGNRLGLQDVLRALQRSGGDLSQMWSLRRTMALADWATGTKVMSRLYRTMGNRAYAPKLERLWRDLGVRVVNRRIVLDSSAPLAAIRRAITDRPSKPLLIAKPRLVRPSRTARTSAW